MRKRDYMVNSLKLAEKMEALDAINLERGLAGLPLLDVLPRGWRQGEKGPGMDRNGRVTGVGGVGGFGGREVGEIRAVGEEELAKARGDPVGYGVVGGCGASWRAGVGEDGVGEDGGGGGSMGDDVVGVCDEGGGDSERRAARYREDLKVAQILARAALGDEVADGPSDGGWEADAFPGLAPGDVERGVRYVGLYGSLAYEEPGEEGGPCGTLASRCMKYAGLTWVELFGMRRRDGNFDAVVAEAEAARRAAVADALESVLQSRAYRGQREKSKGPDGRPIETRKIDNALAYKLLTAGHDAYAKKAWAKDDPDDATTLVVARRGSEPPKPGADGGAKT